MAESHGAKSYGLRFTLGGAPESPHTVFGLTGWFWPSTPTPVGMPGEVSVDRAKAAAKDPGCPVELVEMSRADADKRRAWIAEWRAEHRSELKKAPIATAVEIERKRAETADASPKES